VLLVDQAWIDQRLPMGCHRPSSFARLLREMQRADRFGPTWETRVGAGWDRIAAAASGRLIDHWRHGTAIDLAYGRRSQLAGGLGLALAGGALLGLFLAG
jgi:hypothetical protein